MRGFLVVAMLGFGLAVGGCPPTCDFDGDGAEAPGCGGADCDDGNAGAAPGLVEVCDGVDNDCDTKVREDVDIDHDGHTACDEGAQDCDEGMSGSFASLASDVDDDGYCYGESGQCGSEVDQPGDCNDCVAATHPGAEEVQDGMDNDCDGEVDEEQ